VINAGYPEVIQPVGDHMPVQYSRINRSLVLSETTHGRVIWSGQPDGYPVQKVLSRPGLDGCFVLLDRDTSPKWGDFLNILKIEPNGNIQWRAELPDSGNDTYVDMKWSDDNILTAWSWSCYMVTLNQTNGRVLTRVFTK
jgi:hypothetical protein